MVRRLTDGSISTWPSTRAPPPRNEPMQMLNTSSMIPCATSWLCTEISSDPRPMTPSGSCARMAPLSSVTHPNRMSAAGRDGVNTTLSCFRNPLAELFSA